MGRGYSPYESLALLRQAAAAIRVRQRGVRCTERVTVLQAGCVLMWRAWSRGALSMRFDRVCLHAVPVQIWVRASVAWTPVSHLCRNLRACAEHSPTTLRCVWCDALHMQIKTLMGAKKPLDVEPSTTVRAREVTRPALRTVPRTHDDGLASAWMLHMQIMQIKEAMQEKEGVAVSQMRLLYSGKQLYVPHSPLPRASPRPSGARLQHAYRKCAALRTFLAGTTLTPLRAARLLQARRFTWSFPCEAVLCKAAASFVVFCVRVCARSSLHSPFRAATALKGRVLLGSAPPGKTHIPA
ncbi:hypothetical protein EON66_05050 [archaeon]|nr:MAG: hypothetical protein EON66_05050 [archaeon]